MDSSRSTPVSRSRSGNGPGSVSSRSTTRNTASLSRSRSCFWVWYHRDRLRAARKEGNYLGLIFIAAGVLCYLVAARAFQPRVALFGFPFLVYG
ncbi:MAG: hypothetical protein M3429_04580, partial [Verrucomicrobiota bacterium]|nr:hypothetical protein [Verrucomicrobiota bacterium]